MLFLGMGVFHRGPDRMQPSLGRNVGKDRESAFSCLSSHVAWACWMEADAFPRLLRRA
jgi:hypothetical protein